MENQKLAIICARVSTPDQTQGYSLDAQIKLIREYAANQKIKVFKEFVFPETASRPEERKIFKEIMNLLSERKDIKIILTEKVDRLTRNGKDGETLNDWMSEDEERQIHFIKQNLIVHKNASAHEKFLWDIFIAIAKQYSNNLSEETKKGLKEKFDQGYFPGWAPLGYLNKEVDGKKTTVPDPERWHLVKKAFKMYLTADYSVVQITEALYKKGLRSKNGIKVPYSVMTNILRNPFFSGRMRWNGQEKVGNYKAMITPEQHRQILTIMDAHNYHACRRRKHRFLLRGFAFCDICGQRYTADQHRSGKISNFYHCSARVIQHSNKNQNVETAKLEKQVEELFKNIQFSKEFIDLTVEKVKKFYEEKKKETELQKRTLLNRKMSTEEKRRIAEEKLIAGTFSDEDFIRLRERFRNELNNIQEATGELEAQHDIDIDTAREVLMLSRNIYKAYKKAPYEIKRLYLSFFWDKFLVRDKKIVKAKPTELIEVLLRNKKIFAKKLQKQRGFKGDFLLRPNLLRGQDSNLWNY